MIQILDFGAAGNVMSVANAFRRAKAKAKVVKRYDASAGGLVIPGVGSFSVVPKIVSALGGRETIAGIETPVLCICLGMQAMLEESEETPGIPGLGMLAGRVQRLKGKERLPQLGWNRVKLSQKDKLFEGIADNSYFYFANSYAAFPKSRQAILAETSYGQKFASAVRKGNWRGVQFHPEKSGAAGQKIIGNFARICREWDK